MSGCEIWYQDLPRDPNLLWSRLLTLCAGFADDPIACDLTASAITAKTKYEALSYVWGTSQAAYNITVNGEPGFNVTENLHRALARLRLKDQSRVLWVDAVCINQTDLAEKADQVSRMDDIYTHAERVLIWLGDCDVYEPEHLIAGQRIHEARERDEWTSTMQDMYAEASEDAFAQYATPPSRRQRNLRPPKARTYVRPTCVLTPEMRRIGEVKSAGPPPAREIDTVEALELAKHVSALPTCEPSVPENLADRLGEHMVKSIARCSSADEVDRNLWWKRVWIIQELLLAQSVIVYCGTYELAWETCKVVLADDFPLSPLDDLRRRFANSDVAATGHSASDPELGLLDLLRATVSNQASDPRDKIYAIMHLTQGQWKYQVRPDYTAAPGKIFAEAALHCLVTTCTFDILFQPFRRFALGGTRDKRCMSWIPDLSLPPEASGRYWYNKPVQGRWNTSVPERDHSFAGDYPRASPPVPKMLLRVLSDLRLSVVGYKIDRVATVYQLGVESISFANEACDISEHFGALVACNDDRRALVSSSHGCWREWSLMEAIYAVFKLDSYNRDGISPFARTGTDRSNFVRVMDKVLRHDLTVAEGRAACSAFEYGGMYAMRLLEQVMESMDPGSSRWGGHFFVTQQGLVGFGPADAEVGDVVTVPSGAHVPFVLRPIGSDFALLGDAYVHGLMRGAMRIKMERGEVQLETFVLL
ncbi:hypothetical protein LTR95_001689 [Oleoguttula sp. CCFEE 5521]